MRAPDSPFMRILREPLFQFLLLGGGLFGLYMMVSEAEPGHTESGDGGHG